MELVYLWIEKYKNIENQGFNFSPRFVCKYDEKNKMLEIIDKEKTGEYYPKNFFGKNINITAIVGENGSGKSNINESIISILDILKEKIEYKEEKLFLVYFFNKKYFVKGINVDLEKINNQKIENLSLENNKCFSIYFNYTLDVIKNNKTIFNNLYHRKDDYTTPITMLPNKKNKNIDIEDIDYHTQNAIIDFAIRNNIDFSEIKDYFIPNKIKILLNKQKIISTIEENKVVEYHDKIHDNIKNLNLKEKDDLKKVKIAINVAFNDSDTIINFRIIRLKHDINDYLKKQKKDLLDKNIKDYSIPDWKNITKLYLISKLELIDRMEKDLEIEDKIKSLLDNDKEFIEKIKEKGEIKNQKAKVTYKFFKKIYKENKLPFKFDDNNYINIKENENFVKLLPAFINAEIFNEKNINFESLSFGQKFMMRFSYNLIYQLNKIKEIKNKENPQKYTNINLLLDEIELGLHPNWQKNFVYFLIKVLNKFKDTFNFNIIISSHSPFILSDLPKDNVIFLKKDEENGNCINDTNNVDINPFGANIHTLLSHGFFMKDGLMGEFAKEKIQSIIKYHKEILKKDLTKKENKKQRDEEKEEYEKKSKQKFWQIQSIIGDDYLKQVIKNHLVEIEKILYDEYLIDKEIEKLQDEIDRLNRLKK
ncbi:hypothetical protein CRV00_05140 [Malaciobacter molluscorum]|uniref:AAA family ATPase n=1 Tax=Malaciobacter molluscorum TaxID=1032072 RepID=UPI00100A5F47|nr:AAA family ATPase [Malaciobacter molluscorum]RXJ95142.1 hypothetical protein CRV00_05140 [Malaciobacter molluscorum]